MVHHLMERPFYFLFVTNREPDEKLRMPAWVMALLVLVASRIAHAHVT
jgi:hypothetical protein